MLFVVLYVKLIEQKFELEIQEAEVGREHSQLWLPQGAAFSLESGSGSRDEVCQAAGSVHRSMTLEEKLTILTDAAKYDVACTSSGVERKGDGKHLGSAAACGICHTFASDGRCVSLLKILMTNICIFDCKYCINRKSNDVPRAAFTPAEIVQLTMEFYRRNYIEGLFLSSGVIQSPAHTMELLYETLRILREDCEFQGYIHVKGIPGAPRELIEMVGHLADRMSVNLELPTGDGLRQMAPHKNRKTILAPMRQIQQGIVRSKNELEEAGRYRKAEVGFRRRFVPAGQSTQMIIGATPENDFQIMKVAEALYQGYQLKRVFYSAYVDVNHQLPQLTDSFLKETGGIDSMYEKRGMASPPLLREHRLYQADWLLRYYGFEAGELLSEEKPNFNVLIDPKCEWALRHLEQFPVEVNRADYYTLLRVPGLGVRSAKRIVAARRHGKLDFADIRRMGVVLKRAQYFLTCQGRMLHATKLEEDFITRQLVTDGRADLPQISEGITYRQMNLFDDQSFCIKPDTDTERSAVHGQL